MHGDCSDNKKFGNVHSGKSKLSDKAHMHHLDIEDIIPIIKFSFHACAFQAIGENFRQICGTSMDNQVSPILSGCAIIAAEVTWLRSYGHLLSSNIQDSWLWIRRYADNRAILVKGNGYHQNDMVQCLASLNFYRKPVQLADEGPNEFLGFIVDANTREVRYNMHPELWRYRNITSAGSLRLRLSRYFRRKHLIQKYTFPEAVMKQHLRELWQLYKDMGFPEDRL